jgi:hypothetical protein
MFCPLGGGLPSPFISQRERSGYREREKISPRDRVASPALHMGPAGPIDDGRGAPCHVLVRRAACTPTERAVQVCRAAGWAT